MGDGVLRLQGLERGLDKPLTGSRKADAARLVDMAVEEERRHAEGGGEAVIVCSAPSGQKAGQDQHLVGIGRACRTADGAADYDSLAAAFRMTAFFLHRHVYEPRGIGLSAARDGFVQAALKALKPQGAIIPQ